ncbi:MAG: peptidoglycan-binding domain-containing protein, partial [Boseongicola sp.]|nr:peptidoglycan-binding domain-containing protein [Boseongicola sp.]
GAIGDEAGYRIYLERFPEGEFSELARARLNDIEREKRRATDARDRQLWDEASIVNSRQAYADYLTISPNGAFRDEAIARIEAIDEAERAASTNSRAAREEEALNLNSTTRRILESRLDRLGLKPGKVDGTFDDNTRRAIRRYQQARQLPETGYLNENVVVRLLADSVRSVLR